MTVTIPAAGPGTTRIDTRTANPVLDVVIPACNEETDLEPCVRRLHAHLAATLPYRFRITVADNASTDTTLQVAERLAREFAEVEVRHLDLKDRGRALNAVWSTSDAPVVAYMDVDLSTDLAALGPLVAPLISGHSDVAIGARLAVEHLVSLGRRRIATVAGPQDQTAAVHRLSGWRKTLADAGLESSGLAEEADFTLDGGREAMDRLLAREPELDAVFVASDVMAAGVLQSLGAAGRRVPADVAVVGFDDHPALATAMNPPLTTVHLDPAAQVRQMVATLTALLAGEPIRPRRQVLPVSLKLRESA
ncbi:substrate-binding domain-containing protein [Amycolatopsis methanolica]|uniref:Glycosyl transferase n=1 Tax=Amycolatopsis methanolica 239 TaxID=1068978 RepID=A0A076MVJ0_AMYME|nr:substrate-binding domain-containing protein [Amycolatopsis methanolica]AIJ21817.1 glycosyl transferase [Amycolatopsis methanolica 239]